MFRNEISYRLSRVLWLHGCACGADGRGEVKAGCVVGIVRISARATAAIRLSMFRSDAVPHGDLRKDIAAAL
jgi:hypothetical protein